MSAIIKYIISHENPRLHCVFQGNSSLLLGSAVSWFGVKAVSKQAVRYNCLIKCDFPNTNSLLWLYVGSTVGVTT